MTCGIILSSYFFSFLFFSFFPLFLKGPIRAPLNSKKANHSQAPVSPNHVYELVSLTLSAISLFSLSHSLSSSLSASSVRPTPVTSSQHAPDQQAAHAIKRDRRWPQPETRCHWALLAAFLPHEVARIIARFFVHLPLPSQFPDERCTFVKRWPWTSDPHFVPFDLRYNIPMFKEDLKITFYEVKLSN